jgi:hypothetical protein
MLTARPTLFSGEILKRLEPAYDALHRFPLKDSARESLGRQLRMGVTDEALADMVIRLYEEDALHAPVEDAGGDRPEPQIVCSLGLQTPALAAPAEPGTSSSEH